MEELRFGIIGCGAIARAHLEAIAVNRNSEVTLLADKYLPRARQLADDFNVQTAVTDYQEGCDSIDAAIVALPHHLHAQVSTDLLQRGIHVLVEKPMALTSRDCEAMIQEASTAKMVLSVGLARRFFLSSQFLKRVFENRLLGDIIDFDFREGTVYKWPVSSDFAFRKETGGGVLADIGTHALDLLLWWLGDYESVEYYDDAMGGVEADCEIHLKMRSGANGVVELSRTRDLRNTCIVRGTHGTVEVDTTFNSKIRLTAKGSNLSLNGLALRDGMPEEHALDIYCRQIDDFVEAIHQDRLPLITGAEGKKSVDILETCYASRKLLKPSWIFLDGITTKAAVSE